MDDVPKFREGILDLLDSISEPVSFLNLSFPCHVDDNILDDLFDGLTTNQLINDTQNSRSFDMIVDGLNFLKDSHRVIKDNVLVFVQNRWDGILDIVNNSIFNFPFPCHVDDNILDDLLDRFTTNQWINNAQDSRCFDFIVNFLNFFKDGQRVIKDNILVFVQNRWDGILDVINDSIFLNFPFPCHVNNNILNDLLDWFTTNQLINDAKNSRCFDMVVDGLNFLKEGQRVIKDNILIFVQKRWDSVLDIINDSSSDQFSFRHHIVDEVLDDLFDRITANQWINDAQDSRCFEFIVYSLNFLKNGHRVIEDDILVFIQNSWDSVLDIINESILFNSSLSCPVLENSNDDVFDFLHVQDLKNISKNSRIF